MHAPNQSCAAFLSDCGKNAAAQIVQATTTPGTLAAIAVASMHHPPVPPHKPHRVPASAVAAFIQHEPIEAMLRPWIAEPGDRALVARCLLDVGPAHHRGANYVLLRLLGMVLDRLGPADADPLKSTASIAIPLRLPPPFASQQPESFFPLKLPTDALLQLATPGSRDVDSMVDCLIDGPPQHALANAAMLCLLEAILARLEASTGATP